MRLIFLLSMIFAQSAFSYVRTGVPEGAPPLYRGDATHIQFLVNLSRGSNISGSDSDILSAIQNAANTWSAIPGAGIRFNPIQTTTLTPNLDDAHDVISFQTTPSTASVVKDALAVTLTNPTPDGLLIDTDIVFNPDPTVAMFSTSPSQNTIDLQSVATHEMGHSLGADHTGIYGATMFYATSSNEITQRILSEDDLAFAREAYPVSGGPAYGRITGHLFAAAGGLLHGGLVTAVDTSTGVTVGGITATNNGIYSFQVPVGNYLIYAEPIAGQLDLSVFSLSSTLVSTNFEAGFYGGNASPQTVPVGAGSANSIDFSLPSGKSTITVQYGDANLSPYFSGGPQVLPSGQSNTLEIAGPGVDTLSEQDIHVLGPATLHPGSLVAESPLSGTPAYPVIRFMVDVPARSNIESASLFFSHGGNTAAFSGALILTPVKPSFPAAGVVNAFTFTGSGIAPGEDISIFGTTVGPAAMANTPDSSGTYSTSLSGITVAFDGQPAPLFYVSPGQINLQAPFEIAGKSNTSIVVSSGGTLSDPVSVAVTPAAPGLYPSAVNNDDASLNSAAHPVKRGSYIIVYGTGQGPITPAVGTGKAAPSGTFAYAGATTVNFGGQTVTPYFSGMAPGFVGLWQISVQVPTSLTSGTQQLQVSVDGVQTAPINVSVQ